ncbi:hypothetical protein K7X08_036359 [Anisodus acutangulus]|uniref:TF-B3 domain-containing protein n=1 Tax=Anisodus acutangulus TaxID=402998 RepID=A0A9Q1QVU3_9SOLA|nr:hypothetical protein K7X08_036359 [Anisodus acutangulus]
MWPIGVTKTGRNFHFQYGWEKFIKENTIEFGDFLTMMKMVHLTSNYLEQLDVKKGAGGLKLDVKEEDEEEINVEHQKSEVPKRKWPNSSSYGDSDEDDEDYAEPHSKGRRVEEEEEKDDDDEEYAEEVTEEEEEETEKAPRSKHRHVEEDKETENAPRSKSRFAEEEDDDEEEEYEETEEQEENERESIFKKKASRSNADSRKRKMMMMTRTVMKKLRKRKRKRKKRMKAGCKRATARKMVHDYFGTDIFRSGRATRPKNPYFVTKIRAKRRDQLYIPIDVVRDNKLELPSSMIIRDPAGREFGTKLESWKDGRIWLHGGWHNLCRWNLVGKDDSCICEFVRGKGQKGLHLKVFSMKDGRDKNFLHGVLEKVSHISAMYDRLERILKESARAWQLSNQCYVKSSAVPLVCISKQNFI